MMSYRFLPLLLLASTAHWAAAAPLRVAIGETKPPYVDAELKQGIEYEIITTAFKQAGIEIDLQHMPNKRAQVLFEQGKLDAAINTTGKNASDVYIVYKNMAIALCERNIKLNAVRDLAQYQVGAFHNAHQFLGDDFAHIASKPQQYMETAQQYLLNRMLALGRIDVAISDISIFQHFNLELEASQRRALCPYALFPPTQYRLTFQHSAPQQKFNRAIAQLKASQFYESLAKKYGLTTDKQQPYFKP